MLKRVVYAAILLTALPCLATPGDERWTATSTTATSITGDVTLSANALTFANGVSLPIARVRNVTFADDTGKQVPASIYRVTAPADPPLLQGNTLCGRGNVNYIVIWHVAPIMPGQVEGRAFAVYDTIAEPPPTVRGACGTFYYEPAASTPAPQRAASGPLHLNGTASIGSATRPAQLEIACFAEHGRVSGVSFTLTVPNMTALKPTFDVLPLEGPGSQQVAGRISFGSASLAFSPQGSFVNDTDFAFSGGFSRGSPFDVRQAQPFVAALTPGHLVWQINNPSPFKPRLEAGFDLTDEDLTRARTNLGPCAAGGRR